MVKFNLDNFMLFESEMLDKMGSKNIKKCLINETLLDVRQKNASNMSDNEFKKLLSYDPQVSNLPNIENETLAVAPESYVRWLLKMNKLGELSKVSPENMKQYLKTFNQAKVRKNLLPNNDINSYKSIEELTNALQTVKNNLTANQKNKDAKRNQKELQGEKELGMYMDGAVELLFNGQKWEVWTPHTYEGSKALRRGASWCTGGDTCYYYDNYTADGTLYVIINKVNPKEKLQLFVPNEGENREREFRDANNNSVKFRDFVHENSELLDFFLTQENVTNSYENLEDPDADDEWDDERENEIMYEYDLEYAPDDYTINMTINYDDLLDDSYYTDPRDYKDVASNGYLEDGGWGNINRLKDDIIDTTNFVDEINWNETALNDLYEQYKYETNNECKFETFLYTLFNTNDGEFSNDDVFAWLTDKFGSNTWDWEVRKHISMVIASETMADFIFDKLRDIGWDPNKFHNHSYYREQFVNAFSYNFEDCHSIEEFYRDYADNGNKSKHNIMQEYEIYINEGKGEINPEYAQFDYYNDDLKDNDAKEIYNMFSASFVYDSNDDEDIENDSDEKINEVLKLAGIQI